MTKSELCDIVAQKFPEVSITDIEKGATLIFRAMSNHLIDEGARIEIRGFGTFSLQRRGPRKARNPKTGQSVFTEARLRPRFKAGKKLRDRVKSSVIKSSVIKSSVV